MKKFVAFIFRMFGWKIAQNRPENIDKAVVVMGPHTSNWDFIIGRMAFAQYGVKGKYLIKSELFFPPLGWFLKSIGGVPVYRSSKSNMTEQAVKHFKNNDTMYMVFTPEGTRSYNPNWKRGFYYIAKNANVPILLGFIDYEKKIGGFHGEFHPTDDVNADIKEIKKILSQYKGRFPEKGIKAED